MTAAWTIRDAQPADHDAVRALCEPIWSERNGDYLPRVYPDWITGDDRRTRVAVRDGDLIGIAQCVLLTETEAWSQGLRVDEDARRQGVAASLMDDLFAWAADQGAVIARSMVFSWNPAGMGVARGVGFEPTTAFRFVHPTPTDGTLPGAVVRDDALAWQGWTDSRARTALSGLALDETESWAMRELRRADLRTDRPLVVVDDGIAAVAVRGRSFEEANDGVPRRGQEYVASAWRDHEAADTLCRAIGVDAADRGADETRVVVPEDPRLVSDVAFGGHDIAAEPHFVFSADLAAVTD